MKIPPKRKPLNNPDQRARKQKSTALAKKRKKCEGETGLKVRLFNPANIRPSKPRKQPLPRNVITHDKLRDIDFQHKVLEELNTLNTQDTWGLVTRSVVKKLLDIASPPTTNLELGTANISTQALFLTTKQAKAELGFRSVDVPVFVQGQQDFVWSTNSRPISQLLSKYTTLDETVDVNITSLPYSGVSFARKTIADLRSRFSENVDHGDAWNALDLKCPLPDTYGICPKFLQNDNCDLLSRIKRRAIARGSAGRSTAKTASLTEWREVERWILLAEAGAHTAPHQDSHALDTFININEGEIGFGWLDRPSEQQLEAWAKDPSKFRGGVWCFVVLRSGRSVWFPAGTVHFVFRRQGNGRQTMGIGGHILRCSVLERWAKVMAIQLSNPKATNEKMAQTAPKYLEAVACIVSEAGSEGRLEGFGGKESVAKFRREAENCYSILERRYPRMKLGLLLQAIAGLQGSY